MDDDSAWIQAAVLKFEGPLLRYARRFATDDARARDIVQDTFLQLCRQKRVRVEPRLAEWLFTVCRRRSIDVHKKEARMNALANGELVESAAPPASARIDRDENIASLLAALAGLPENQQEVLRLKFQDDFSYAEIARITGKSVNHVGVLIHNGIKTLRSALTGSESTNRIPL